MPRIEKFVRKNRKICSVTVLKISFDLLRISVLGIVAGHMQATVAAQEVACPVSAQVDSLHAQAEDASLQGASAQPDPENSILVPVSRNKFAQVPLLIYFARHGCPEDIQLGLQLNPNAGVYDQFGFSALHACLFNSCQECALAMIPLLAKKVGIDYPTEKKMYLLFTQKDQTTIFDNTIFDATELVPYNRTALFLAAKMGNQPLMQALLDAGANINHQDSQGLTPLDMLMDGVKRIAKYDPDWKTKPSHYPATVKFLYVRGAQTEVYELSSYLSTKTLEQAKARFVAENKSNANYKS